MTVRVDAILCGIPTEHDSQAPLKGPCRKCGKEHELCPKCYGPVFSLFGLGAANGYGLYWVCDDGDCDWQYTPPGQDDEFDPESN